MGNPPVHRAGATPPSTPPSKNGILARVGGEFIARGSNQLPTAGPEQMQRTRSVVVDNVPDLGAVRITYVLNSYTHGRSRHWHWLAVHAESAHEQG